jgi:hypothetical protein
VVNYRNLFKALNLGLLKGIVFNYTPTYTLKIFYKV